MVPRTRTRAHFDLAITLTNLSSPEEAAEHGNQAFALRPDTCLMRQRAAKLDAVLVSRYPSVPGVQEFHHNYHRLASQIS